MIIEGYLLKDKIEQISSVVPTILLDSLNNLKPDNTNTPFDQAASEPKDIKPTLTVDGQVITGDESMDFVHDIKQESAHFSGQGGESSGISEMLKKQGKPFKGKMNIEIAKRKVAIAKGKVSQKYSSKAIVDAKVDVHSLPKRGRPKKTDQRPVQKKEKKDRRSHFILVDNGKEYKVKSWKWPKEKRIYGGDSVSEYWDTIPAENPNEFYCVLCPNSDRWTNVCDYVQHWMERHVKLTENGSSLVECPHCSHTQYHKFCRTQMGRWLAFLVRFYHHMVKKHDMSTPSFVPTMICKKCGYSAPSNSRYITEHQRVCAHGESRKKYMCNKCGTELLTTAGFLHHNRVCQVMLLIQVCYAV